MDSQNGQFPSCWNHQRLESIGFKVTIYKQFYFEDHTDVEGWLRDNINNPLHVLFVGIVYFSVLFGNESYIERNKTLN